MWWDKKTREQGRETKQRKQVQLCRDTSPSPGNPAEDNVDEGKHWGLSRFKQNSRPPAWTSKQKKNKHSSVTNVNPMCICFLWVPDVPQRRSSSDGAPYETHVGGSRQRQFKGAAGRRKQQRLWISQYWTHTRDLLTNPWHALLSKSCIRSSPLRHEGLWNLRRHCVSNVSDQTIHCNTFLSVTKGERKLTQRKSVLAASFYLSSRTQEAWSSDTSVGKQAHSQGSSLSSPQTWLPWENFLISCFQQL